MDFSTGLGLLAAAVVVPTMIFMGGDPRMFISDHAMIRPHLRVENPVAAQGPWNLSANRANPVRRKEGLPSTNIYEVAGKADTDPMFPDDP
jgi:hypothetical protein